MLLWDIIRDWFVMNVWGGFTSGTEAYGGFLGRFVYLSENGELDEGLFEDTSTLFFRLDGSFSENYANLGGGNYISIGDWLSTTSTIIVLLAVCFALYFLVRYFFRMFAGLISGR